MKRILMIANDINRWGPARLPESFSKAGVEVAVLCQIDNPLYHSSFIARNYAMENMKSWRKFGPKLAQVMSDWKPDLIMPCDEIAVVMLHYFLKRPKLAARYLNPDQFAVLHRSLGQKETLDAMVLKENTRLLAESLGVRFPKAVVVGSVALAQQAACRLGYPVFLKASFSWGGDGTIQCNNENELAAAFKRLSTKTSVIKNVLRRLLARDWYYATSTIEVQQAIPGESVMYSVAAIEGKVLGGLFARRATRLGATGPSTVVSIDSNEECAGMVAKMISGMRASGFLAFDFMCCEKTGAMYLLECNPRPNQIFHLGKNVNVDLCQSLADALNGNSHSAQYASGSFVASLFPQLWMQDQKSALETVATLDIPKNDQKLFDYMLSRGEARGIAKEHLLKALRENIETAAEYTFG